MSDWKTLKLKDGRLLDVRVRRSSDDQSSVSNEDDDDQEEEDG